MVSRKRTKFMLFTLCTKHCPFERRHSAEPGSGGGSESSRSGPPRSTQTTTPGFSIRIQGWLRRTGLFQKRELFPCAVNCHDFLHVDKYFKEFDKQSSSVLRETAPRGQFFTWSDSDSLQSRCVLIVGPRGAAMETGRALGYGPRLPSGEGIGWRLPLVT